MNALDTLSTFGSELTAEQLDDVDGGALFWAGVATALAIGYLIEKYG